MLENNDEEEDLEKTSERQPWDPPTEEDATKAVESVLAPHLTSAEEGSEEGSETKGDAIPEEKKEQENAGGESEEGAPKEKKEDEEGEELPVVPVTETTPAPGRLEKRIAKLYIQNLNLSEQDAPSVDEVLAELTSGKFTHDQKMHMLHIHRRENKQLRGVDIKTKEPDEEEDGLIIKESQKEEVRREVRKEEQEAVAITDFITFIGEHPELDEENKDFSPALASAVELLWKGGMPIRQAYETVTNQFEAVRLENEKLLKKGKQKAFSGAMTASTKVNLPKDENEYTWAEFDQLMREDPVKWQKMIADGYEPKG